MASSSDTALTLEQARYLYSRERATFDRVLEIARRADESRVKAATLLASAAEVHLTKAYLHGIALGKILPAVPGPTSQLHDFPSAAVLVRSLAETYLAFRYACVEPKTQEDIDFRDALMYYHYLYKRNSTLDSWSADDALKKKIRQKLDRAKERLKANPVFAAQCESDRKHQLSGRTAFHRDLPDIVKEAGITPKLWTSFWIFLSQFEHSSPMAIINMRDFRADDPLGPYNLAYLADMASCFLARFTWDLSNLFRQKKPAFEIDDVQLLMERMLRLERAKPVEVPDVSTY